MLVDNRTYFLVENSDRSLQIVLMNCVNIVSTVVNFLLFYLILTHSKREKRFSRVIQFLENLLFYIAQIHFGSVANVVILLPFPGIYCIGFASKALSSFWLGVIWILIFGFFLITMLIEVMLRLNAVARPGKLFDFKLSTYTWLVIFANVFLFAPVGSALTWIYFYQTAEIVKNAVKEFWPNCLKVFDHPGSLVLTNSPLMVFFISLSQFYMIGLVLLYFPFFFGVIYELKQQSLTTSAAAIRFHLKVFKDTIAQNAVRTLFLIVPVIIAPLNYLVFKREDDTIIFTTMLTVMFVSAPIPCTILIFIQKKSFHPFFRSKFLFWKRKETIGNGNLDPTYLQNAVVLPLNS